MLAMIAAVGKKGQLGLGGTLPWHHKEDLRHFKQMTLHHHIVMGKTTFLSLPGLLKDRTTWVVSSTLGQTEGVHLVKDLDEFLKMAKQSPDLYFICGGAKLYQAAWPYVSTIYLSRIDYDGPADVFFPDILKYFDLICQEQKSGFVVETYHPKEGLNGHCGTSTRL